MISSSLPIITSKDNPEIKYLRKLTKAKFRSQYNEFFIENDKIIVDSLKSGYIFKKLYLTKSLLTSQTPTIKKLRQAKITTSVISSLVNKSFSELTTPMGIAAIYQKPISSVDLTKPIVYLNGISDPGNLGTIIRLAAGFGIPSIVLDESCADVFNSKTIQAAKDAIFKVNLFFDKKQTILKKINKLMPIFITAMTGKYKASYLSTLSLFCLILGNETRGVDAEFKKISQKTLAIPTTGAVESLNVATAAAILFYTYYTSRL